MPEQLTDFLTEQLNRRGWSGREFARRIGSAQETIARILRGEGHPSPETVRKIAEGLDVDEAYLLRLAGYLEERPRGLHNAAVIDLAQQIEELPAPAQERAIRVIREVLEAFYTILDPPPSEE